MARGYADAQVLGVVTNKGELVESQELHRKGLMVKLGPGGAELTSRAMPEGEMTELVSREITEDQDPFNYDMDQVVLPPWDFSVLNNLMTANSIHAGAVETKASDYAYNEWELEVTDWAAENIDDAIIDVARAEVTRFLRAAASGKRPIEDMCRDAAICYESLGSAGFEIIRSKNGFIHHLNHIPFSTMRVLQQKRFEETGARYLQRRFQQKAFFVGLNENVVFNQVDGVNFDPLTAADEDFPAFEQRADFVDFDDRFVHAKTAEETDNLEEAANEFYYMARPPFTRSAIYGTPAGVSAMTSMLAQLYIDKYNLQFFAAKGVPQYAIVFKGFSAPEAGEGMNQDPDSEETYPEMKSPTREQLQDTIDEFFKKKLASGDRSVLVLTLFGEADVHFEKLSTDKIEASFADYEKRNRENVRISHRVPGPAMGIYETANLGGGRDTSAMRRYRDHIVHPGQRMFEVIVDSVIRSGLLIPYFRFKMLPMDIQEEQHRIEEARKDFIAGAITLDDYLAVLHRPPLPKGRGKVHIIRTQNVTLLNADEESVQEQLAMSIAKERRFRKLLTGAAALEELDELEKEVGMVLEADEDTSREGG